MNEPRTVDRVHATDGLTVYVPGRVREGNPGDGEPGEDE